MISNIVVILLILSIALIMAATYFYWVDIGGKIGLFRRKFSYLFAFVGWALYMFIVLPF